MIINQNIGSWIVHEMEGLQRQVRLFGDMLSQIDDLSKLIEFYEDEIARPLQTIVSKSRSMSLAKSCSFEQITPSLRPQTSCCEKMMMTLLELNLLDRPEGKNSPEAMDGALRHTESGKTDSLTTQATSLRKRSPLSPVEFEILPAPPTAKQLSNIQGVDSEGMAPKGKKRGRHLLSNDLERYLVEKIRTDCLPKNIVPDRIWVVNQARLFTTKNNVELKCSKGWLDKFMKRNGSLINPRTAK